MPKGGKVENKFRRAIGLVGLVVGVAVWINVPGVYTTNYEQYRAVEGIGLLRALAAIWLLVELAALLCMVINIRSLGAFALGVSFVLVMFVSSAGFPRLSDSPTDFLMGVVVPWTAINILDTMRR